MSSRTCPPHDWQRNPDGWDEGLRCTKCLVTEAELAATGGDAS